MLENEALPIHVRYTSGHHARIAVNPSFGTPDVPSAVRLDSTLDRDLIVSLTSAGFEVRPEGSQTAKFGTVLPVELAWTIQPHGEGRRYVQVLIDGGTKSVDSIVSADRKIWGSFVATAEINGRRVSPNANGLYLLPIEVATLWGLSGRTTSLIAWSIGLLSFVLIGPLIVELLKMRFKLGEYREPPTATNPPEAGAQKAQSPPSRQKPGQKKRR